MGRPAKIIGRTPGFLRRRLGEAKLIDPFRSEGDTAAARAHGIRLAAHAREMCDQGTDMASARRIILEDGLQLISSAMGRFPVGQTLHCHGG